MAHCGFSQRFHPWRARICTIIYPLIQRTLLTSLFSHMICSSTVPRTIHSPKAPVSTPSKVKPPFHCRLTVNNRNDLQRFHSSPRTKTPNASNANRPSPYLNPPLLLTAIASLQLHTYTTSTPSYHFHHMTRTIPFPLASDLL